MVWWISSIRSSVADLGPEYLVARGVGGAQSDVAEAGDAGVAHAVIALRAMGRAPDQLDAVAAGIVERDEVAHLAQLGFLGGAVVHAIAEPFELTGSGREPVAIGDLKSCRLVRRIACEIAQRVFARVGFEVNRAARAFAYFKAEIGGGKLGRAFEVARSQAHIGDILQVDHIVSLRRGIRSRQILN